MSARWVVGQKLFDDDALDGTRRVAAIDYGPCRYETKLYEITDFFESSIWSTFQKMFICFYYKLNLSEEDAAFIQCYDRMFQERAGGASRVVAP